MKRYAADVTAYNSIADEVFTQNNIPEIDLFGFTQKLGTAQFIDHVHYNEKTRALQAAYLAGYIQSYVGRKQTAHGRQ